MALHGVDHSESLKAEHAGIPIIAAALNIGLCSLCIRLFNEAPNVSAIDFDVAKACLRMIRNNAESDNAAGFGKFACFDYRSCESRFIFDQMVGWHDQQSRIGTIG